MKQQKRQLNRVQREMTRDKGALERQEKQLVCFISLHHDSCQKKTFHVQLVEVIANTKITLVIRKSQPYLVLFRKLK